VDTDQALFEKLGARVLSRGAVPANSTIVLFYVDHDGRRTGFLQYSPEAGVGLAHTIPLAFADGIDRILPHLDAAFEARGQAIIRWTRAAYRLAEARHVRGWAEQTLRAHDYRVQAKGSRPAEVWRGYYAEPTIFRELLSLFDLYQEGAYRGGLVAAGPSGTGKTRFFELATQYYEMSFFFETPASLLSPHPGETGRNVRKLLEKARDAAAPSVVFIDEGDTVFPDRSLPQASHTGLEAVQGFLSEWRGAGDDKAVLVVTATNRPEAMDSAILRRFGRRLDFPLPSAAARAGILRDALAAKDIDVPITTSLVRAAAGLSGGWLANVADQAQVIARSQRVAPTIEHVREAIQQVRRQNGTRVSASATWGSLVLPEETKEEVQRIVRVLPYAEEARRQGVDLPKTLLLYGPPGTGKSLLGKVIANESGCAFFSFDASDLLGEFQGHTAPKVQAAFRRLREHSPAIGFIDEITTFVGGPGSGDYGEQLYGMLLTELDGISEMEGDFLLIAATNHIEQVPRALLSRFPKRIHIALADEEQRAKGFALQCAGKRTAFQVDALARLLAPRMAGWSQREIAKFVEEAGYRALDRATQQAEETGEALRVVIKLEDLDIPRLMTPEERAVSAVWPEARGAVAGQDPRAGRHAPGPPE
ncbi:MAG TPA: ATP-binding protein, partial [Longimicrobiaceae bacterium]|nr:ATP-binding protein [Longimicrobiaceae bacterium]